MNQFFKRTFLITTALFFILTLSAGAVSRQTISDKIFIDNTEVSGKTKNEALTILKQKYEPSLKATAISFHYNGQAFLINSNVIQAHYDYSTAINKAFAIVRPTEPPTTPVTTDSAVSTEQAVTTDSAAVPSEPVVKALPKINVKLDFVYNKYLLSNYFKKLSQKINTKPVDSVMTVKGKKFYFSDSKNGTALNTSKATAFAEKAITPGKTSTITLPVDTVPTKYTKDNLLDIKDELGEYTTYFKASDANRVVNITVAATNANNFIVMPGEVFSLNKEIGPRLEKYGFKLAHVIVNNRFVDGIGGGVCQVSTTLYNAALKADLSIVERTHHSIPSTYVPIGRDATVSGDSKDLKFLNNTSSPLYITNEVKKNQITFKIYGKNDDPNRRVRIKTQTLDYKISKTVTVEDPTLPKGTVLLDVAPHNAYVVRSYREIYEKGKLVKTEELYIDKYPLITGIKKIGTKPIENDKK